MIKRLAVQQDRLFGDQKEFVYYAPGAFRIAEKASVPVKNRSHTIVTNIDLKGGEEGVIVSVGGMTGGFTMFIKGRRLHYVYNFLDGVYYTMKSPRLPKGKTELKFNFIKTGNFAGTGELWVNGEKVAETDMPRMHISTYSLAETFDIGIDTGTQVTKLYKDPFAFQGELDRVVVTLTD
jgi:arylsulfatase